MPTGDTTVGVLDASIPTIIAAARQVREYKGAMSQAVERVTLKDNTGTAWNEVSFAALQAQSVTENTLLDNPQQLSDTLFSITPQMSGIQTFMTYRVYDQLAKESLGRIGTLAENAMVRKMDEDGLTVLDGATTSLSGAGTTLVSGIVAAAVSRIAGNTTEPGMPPYYAILHPFQIKDFYDELTAGVGTAAIPAGLTAETLRAGYKGNINGAMVIEDGNISIDASDDAKGGVFAKEGIVLVMSSHPRHFTRVEPHKGGGGESMWLYEDYAYGERAAGSWLYEVYSDALAPTS